MIKKHVTLILFTIFIFIGCGITKHATVSVEAENTNNKPYIQEAPSNLPDLSERLQQSIRETDVKKFNGSNKEVQDFITYLLTTSTRLPEDIKSKYSNTTPGTPLFVKDRRDPSIDTLRDTYIVPLLRENKIVGQCTVMVYDGDELGFGVISDCDDTNDSIFRRDINKILNKVKHEKSVEIKNYQLAIKPDYKNKTGRNSSDPQLEITTTDGKIFYYSTRGLILDKSEADLNSSTKNRFLGGS